MENLNNPSINLPQEPQLIAEVLATIEQDQVAMKPRWYFVLIGGLAAAGVFITALAALYVCSLVVFVLQQDGSWAAASYGTRGLYVFLVSAPWHLIGLSLLFVILLEVAVRRYAFAYRRSLLVSLLVILLVVFIGALVVAATPLHVGLLRQSVKGGVPVAGTVYRNFGEARHLSHVHLGVVESFTREGFVLYEFSDQRAYVRFDNGVILPLMSIGDRVAVFGEKHDQIIYAFGVKKFVLVDDGRSWPVLR